MALIPQRDAYASVKPTSLSSNVRHPLHHMTSAKSPLCRLPKGLVPKQLLFLNGIRHAAEFTSLAYDRLSDTLTRIARQELDATEEQQLYTMAFMDAWTIIDAFDRFQTLMNEFPSPNHDKELTKKNASSLARTARDIRNVADHLAARAEYVVSKQGTALGELTWFTFTEGRLDQGRSCAILPGGVPDGTTELVNPIGQKLRAPTDMIHLAAGEYRISLSDLVARVDGLTADLERQLEPQIPTEVPDSHTMPTDVLFMALFSFNPPDA